MSTWHPKILVPLFCLAAVNPLAAEKLAFSLYDKDGEKADYSKMILDIASSDYFFFGELHDNPISHWFEYEILKDVHEQKKEIKLGAEFFESDNQLILSEYLSKIISVKNFEDEMRLWNNYKTDYKPLVTFALEKGIDFIATNIPRRYAAYVNQNGLEALEKLSREAKKYISPLPVEYDSTLPSYSAMESGPMGKMLKETMGVKGPRHLAEAQAVKDSTMAYFIFKNKKAGELFIHFNGAYHSDNYTSILWYLKKYDSEQKIVTLTTVLQEDVSSLEDSNKRKADYIIAVDSNMTRSY